MRQERLDKILPRIGESALTDLSLEPSGGKKTLKGSDLKCDPFAKKELSEISGSKVRRTIFLPMPRV